MSATIEQKAFLENELQDAFSNIRYRIEKKALDSFKALKNLRQSKWIIEGERHAYYRDKKIEIEILFSNAPLLFWYSIKIHKGLKIHAGHCELEATTIQEAISEVCDIFKGVLM